jgi:hypothetical protein
MATGHFRRDPLKPTQLSPLLFTGLLPKMAHELPKGRGSDSAWIVKAG